MLGSLVLRIAWALALAADLPFPCDDLLGACVTPGVKLAHPVPKFRNGLELCGLLVCCCEDAHCFLL